MTPTKYTWIIDTVKGGTTGTVEEIARWQAEHQGAFGCDRATLSQWQARGPEYGDRHGHEPEHWATGPAVAIAAAEAMMAGRGGR